ncbi:MAG: YigZ family protein [Deltaproteobacteria bacterium]|nr:YigZ family protein [Deltaproteobacteria bacterium]
MLTLAAPHALEAEIKKSRFIARAARADDRAAAMAFVESASEARANHNCWAYKVGADYRFNDDGEPGGTAGQPILRAIEGQGLDHVAVVVARYFGGIKLGAGGLVRAYGGTAAECLRVAVRLEVRPRVALRVEAPFALTGAIYPLLESFGAQRLKEEFSDTGLVLELSLEASSADAFRSSLRDATRGKAVATLHES